MALTKLRGNIVSASTLTGVKFEAGSITNDQIKDGTIATNKLAVAPTSTGKAIAMSIVFG